MEERRYSSWLLERIAIGDVFRLRLGASSIGRHHSSVIRILDSTYVSRNHAVISVSDDDQKVQIKDLGSVNGIFVNKSLHRNETVEINAEDELGIGVVVNEDANPVDPVFILKNSPLRLHRNVSAPNSLLAAVGAKPVTPKPTAGNPSVSTNGANNNTCSDSTAKSSGNNCHPAEKENIIIISDDDDDDNDTNIGEKPNVPFIISKVKIEKTDMNEQPSCSHHVIRNSVITPASVDDTMNRIHDERCNVTASTSFTVCENRANVVAGNAITNQEMSTSSTMAAPIKQTASNNKSIDTSLLTNQKTIEPNLLPPANVGTAHMPIISNVKQELVRTVSADIKSIFGGTDDVVLDTIKNINPYIYNEIGGTKSLVSGDCISVSSDDEECEKIGELISPNDEEQNGSPLKSAEQAAQAQSPNIFETSANTSNEEELSHPKTDSSKKSIPLQKSNIPEEDYAYEPQSGDEDIEELMFSEVVIKEAEQSKNNYNNASMITAPDNPILDEPQNEEEMMFSQYAINDMKAELADDNIDDFVADIGQVIDEMELSNSELASHEFEKKIDADLSIKKELDSSCWIISDDEDDNELQSKVSGWSAKLCSQNLTQGNMSQIYDIEVSSDAEDEEIDQDDNAGKNCTSKDDDGDDILFYTMKDNEVNDLYLSKKEKNRVQTKSNDDQIDANRADNLDATKSKKMQSCSTNDNTALSEFDKEFVDEPFTVLKNSQDEALHSNKLESPILRTKCIKPKKIITSSSDNDSDREQFSNTLDSPVIKKTRTKTKRVVTSSESEEDVNAMKSVVSSINEKNTIAKLSRQKSLANDCNKKISIECKERKDNNACSKIKEGISLVRANSKDGNISSNQTKIPSIIDESKVTIGSEITAEESTKSNKEKPVYFGLPNEKRGPAIIEAPQLPQHRGKLRGVSALSTKEMLSKVQENIRKECYAKDLKRKWLEKPSITKKREKEKAKVIKESRKERLKEVAKKQQQDNQRTAEKRKTSQDEISFPEHHNKKPKVKITTVNRGAFLAEETERVQIKPPYKIPKVPKVPTNISAIPKLPPNEPSTSSMDTATKTENSSDSFAQQLSKPDILLFKRQNSSDSTDSVPTSTSCLKKRLNGVSESKEKAAVRSKRTTNKLTFDSMQRNFVESHQNQKKLEKISSVRSCLSSTNKPIEAPVIPIESPLASTEVPVERKKKKVRFNDTPIIHYIDRISSATKKVDRKDLMPLSTINDRRHIIRQKYPIIDCTHKIISLILKWSNEWLAKRNAEAQAAGDMVLPMPNQFNTYYNYKSILFPLMKLEYLSGLEREYNTCKLKPFKVLLEYVTNAEDRMVLITKYNDRPEVLKCDLVLLDFNDKHCGTFAYVSANRKGTGSCSTFVFEIIGKNFTKEYLNCFKEIDVRPVIDNIRVEFGAFNAVFQLESTPLFEKILNPHLLLKSKSLTNVKFKYKGFDKLNTKQENILLNAYGKILDETSPNITLIKGPPGTGKSCVITNLALQTLYGDEVRYMDKKILICAQSNGAVDVIASKLFDVQQRMRPNIMFRVIRYGIMDRVHKNVMPIMLQKIVERDQMRKLAERNSAIQEDNKENLKSEILKLEANVKEMQSRNIKGTVEEDELIDKQKQLQMMRNIINQFMRPEDERSIYTWYLTNANIVCTTLSSCVKLAQYVDYFDVCIIDEATQCTEPWTLLPLRFGINSLVLVGDTQQLPATVLSKKAMQLGLGNSMFTRIQKCLENVHVNTESQLPNVICSLQTQYRMHPEICKWPNLYFYKNELINAPITQQFKSPLAPFSILSLAYSQNEHCNDGKISNNLEAEFVVNLLKALDGYIPSKYNSYGVITPYAEHRTQLEVSIRASGISNIMVNTIDSYQGVEKDVIVISNARTQGIGFLANYQRLNVALTRPRKCLILCGNFRNLESVPSWRSLLNNARERKIFHEISATNALDIHRNVISKIKI